MAAQRVLLQQQALMAHAGLMGDKKQREVYVGNLAIGVVTEPVIRELFNAALEAFVPNPSNMPPVVSAHMSGEGRFAFVELRNPELANAAMALDKLSRSMSERWKDIQCRPLVRRARTGKMSRISCHIDSRFCWRIIRITVPRCFNGHVCYCAIKLQRSVVGARALPRAARAAPTLADFGHSELRHAGSVHLEGHAAALHILVRCHLT
eukprot:TRINITY_DN12142_c0_g2_i18.p2 TRINITY_DN12142_c0_g2~~TRINITY_DN12142_c0_g2_i18.p2  ORF type:complete len:208 (+),score=25.22 TRINITY_DN12142_c0_g2_i18:2534-3157(+)